MAAPRTRAGLDGLGFDDRAGGRGHRKNATAADGGLAGKVFGTSNAGPAMNVMTLEGYQAKIEYDEDLDLFRGEVLGLSGGADFYGSNPQELRAEFRKSLDAYLDVCEEKGIAPQRTFSGKLHLRIPPELHERLAIVAQAEGKSINALAQEALQGRVG